MKIELIIAPEGSCNGDVVGGYYCGRGNPSGVLFLKGDDMEHARDWFYFIAILYIGIGIVGYHTINKLQEILDKMEEIGDLIPKGIEKLNSIELKMEDYPERDEKHRQQTSDLFQEA